MKHTARRLGIVPVALISAICVFLCGCEPLDLFGGDEGTDPAAITFQLPESDAVLSEPVVLSVSGADLSTVDFLLDEKVVHRDENAPFEWTLDPEELTEGQHTLRVRATRSDGSERIMQVEITVAPKGGGDPNPEAFEFTIPDNGEIVSSPVTLGVSGSDLVRARFEADGDLLHDDTDDPFEYTLDPTTLSDGEHELAITATRSSGAVETVLARIIVLNGPLPPGEDLGSVGKWRRIVVTLQNTSYTGNPFELEVDGTFTHTSSGTTLTLPGYYAGNDTWKIGFMPTATGQWTFVTSSSDSELNLKTGSLTCTESGLPGMLKADSTHAKKWRFTDGAFAIPIALRMEFFSEPATQSEFTAAADFLEDNNLHMMETRLTEEYGQFGGRHDFIFEGSYSNHQFDLDIWDRMEERMEILTARGLGGHIMFYSDDSGEPGWSAKSETEKLVIRYTVARLCGYPIVWFNSGIDISEYRSSSEVNWMGEQIRALDPYGHPVSSRHSSSSSGMSGMTFNSWTRRTADMAEMLENYSDSSVPSSMDDAWGENRGSHSDKDHTAADIRRAFWKCVLAGGVGGLIRGGGDGGDEDGFYFIDHVASDLESEQWLKLVNPYVSSKLGTTFGTMEPDSSLVSSGGYCIADPAHTKLLFMFMGENDTYTSGNDGDPLDIKLSGISGSYDATWFDPRSGDETNLGTLAGGEDHTVTPPSRDDWILLLEKN